MLRYNGEAKPSKDTDILGMLLTNSLCKQFAPYDHYVPDPASRHYEQYPRSRSLHDNLFFVVMAKQFNTLYKKDVRFKNLVNALRVNP